ncbi:CRAL/TRIO domain-containing protein, partial [Microstroma glucosiphilum]
MVNPSRTRSRETSATGRSSLLEKTYSRYSNYGKGGDNLKKTSSRANSQQTAVENPSLRAFTGVFRKPEEGCRPQPPAKLSDSQEKLLAEMLVYFRERKTYPVSLNAKDGKAEEPPTEWEKLRMLSRESMLRYLRATKWDLNAAKKRLAETIAWRREFGVDSIDPAEVEQEAKSGKETVMGFDNSARPLHYMHPHRNNTKESPTQMRFAVWILESCIDLMPPGVEQLALLINFDNRSRNPTSIANAKLMLYILQNHYVERLGVALCINVPWVFKAFWSAIQSFIDPVTKSKCKFDEGIKEEVPLSQLSSDYGGEVDPTYHHDQYWPDLVKLTQERRAAMLKRFKEQCNSEVGASEWVVRGGND